jgi:hypothetical protein
VLKKILFNVFGVLLTLSGCVWIGQGAGYLPGKLMHGDPQWILWGALLGAVGVTLLYLGNRRV